MDISNIEAKWTEEGLSSKGGQCDHYLLIIQREDGFGESQSVSFLDLTDTL